MTAYAERFASLTDARITSRLGDVKRRITQLGEELEGAVHGRVGGFVNGMLSDLQTHSCRIAVIGQIKAGKSTLINALIRRPDLLPTDINPSTAVITKLYFGAAAEQNNTALFQFFSDEEWERIMSGGRAGAMTMQRHEALRPEQLDEPLEELRQRAEMRLGPQYPALLGKHHLFASVTAGVLDQYISAGDYGKVGAAGDDGRHYSDITKTAEIFLEGQPLGYPSVIIDTPGVNDPFLVRDEITHGNLGEADIYLVVLTAQQPLSQTDMALLRMLKGLQKDRIIAVVNRIDIVDMSGGEAERLASHVRANLKREFPHADIPVILASAYWGNCALGTDEDELTLALASSFTDYAADLARRGETGFEKPGPDWPRDRAAQMLYRASGIPAIISAISRLIGHSVTAEQLLPAASTFGAVAQNTCVSVRYGLKALQGGDSEGWLRVKALDHLQQLEHLLAQVEGALTACEHDFTVLTAEEVDRLRKFMNYTVDNFAEKQREKLILYGSYSKFRDYLQEQMFQLRSQLAEDFYKYITEISKQFLGKQQEAETALRLTMKNALPDLDDVLHFGIQAASLPPPSIMPLSKVTCFDMDRYWQARAHATSINVAEAEKFKQTLIAAILELIDELFQLAEITRQEHVSDALRRLRFLSYSAIYPIAQQLQQLVIARKPASGGLGEAQQGAPFIWEQFLANCRTHLLRCEKLGADAAEIRRQCIQMLSN